MRIQSNALAIAFFSAACLMSSEVFGKIQNEKPKKECGLIDVLGGKDLPGRRPSRKTAAEPTTNKVESPVRIPKRDISDRASKLKKKIDEMVAKKSGDLKPISGPKEAREKIAKLKTRRDSLKAQGSKAVQAGIQEVAKKADRFTKKWSQVAKDTLDGKRRTPDQWNQIFEKLRKGEADQTSGKPVSGDAKKPTAKTVKTPTFSDMRKAFDQKKKPPGMSAAMWTAIQDRFYRDFSKIQAESAAVKKKLKDEMAKQTPIDRAIKIAEDNLERILKSGKKPSKNMAQHLAWQIERARLAQMRELYNRLREAERESEGLGDRIQIEMHPLNPAKTLEQVARTLDTSNRPTAADAERAEEGDLEDLIDLFPELPEGTNPDDIRNGAGLPFGKMVKDRIDKNQKLLEKRNKELAELDADPDADPERTKQVKEDVDWLKKNLTKDYQRLETMEVNERVDKNQKLLDKRNKELAELDADPEADPEQTKQVEQDIDRLKKDLTKDRQSLKKR